MLYCNNFNNYYQGSANCVHGDERPPDVHAKRFLRARKSIKTSLSSTPMLLKAKVIFVSESNNIRHSMI